MIPKYINFTLSIKHELDSVVDELDKYYVKMSVETLIYLVLMFLDPIEVYIEAISVEESPIKLEVE